jgi:hypothetical protein
MRMGNYFSVRREEPCTMSASNESFGMQHPTVVPTNFESTDTTDSPDEADDADEAA